MQFKLFTIKTILTLFLLLIVSCQDSSQEKTMQGFGELRLGMTVQDVKQNFNLDIPEKGLFGSENSKGEKDLFSTNHPHIRITDYLTIRKVQLTFQENRLVIIESNYSEQLHNGLSQIYGLEKRYTSSTGLLNKYKTNSSKVTCVSLNKEKMIIFNNQTQNLQRMKYGSSVLSAFMEVEGFDGL